MPCPYLNSNVFLLVTPYGLNSAPPVFVSEYTALNYPIRFISLQNGTVNTLVTSAVKIGYSNASVLKKKNWQMRV